ncbi:hypothetical protein QBK99_04280 [Corticibacterium sp. UT-5YL-CI-8]|nr:hypothetical protein [Tianweitania sp. UT-5YL-CI-8]
MFDLVMSNAFCDFEVPPSKNDRLLYAREPVTSTISGAFIVL